MIRKYYPYKDGIPGSGFRKSAYYIKQISLFCCALFLGISTYSSAWANPEGAQVSAGQATISQPNANTVHVQQTSDKAVIDWRSFNIAPNETTYFQQPSSSSIVLNRIDPTQGASTIAGKLTANGQIWLVNPAGVVFGPTAKVDVGGLLATTASITANDFMNEHYYFIQSPNWNGAIINNGLISVADKGLVTLVAPGVQNNGVIIANLGKVTLASSNEFVVDFYGDQLINFGMNSQVGQAGVDNAGNVLKDGVKNTGTIIANGGKILVAANTAEDVIDHAINMQGFVQANAAMQQGGEIVLMGGNGKVNVTGILEATGKQSAQKGGKVRVHGKDVILNDNAKIDVSGDQGGGEVLIGGDYQGKNAIVPNAERTFVGANTLINADAITLGQGGKVIVWADNSTDFLGSIFARGGSQGGDGGFVETSAKNLVALGIVNTLAPYGNAGTWLLDPINVAICNAGSSPSCTVDSNATFSNPNYQPTNTATSPSLIFVNNLQTNLSTGNVIVTTTPLSGTGTDAGDITVAAPITWTGATSLTLTAARNIAINSAVTMNTAGATLVLNAANNVTQSAAIAGAGGLTLSSAGTTILNQLNTYTGKTIITSGTVTVSTLANSGTSSSLGSGSTSSIIDLGLATLKYTGTGNSTSRVINLIGQGTIDASGSGALTLSGGITGLGQNLLLTGTGAATESGVIAIGTGSVAKNGAGTWTLSSAASSYSGGTSVNAGTLSVGTLALTGTNSGIGTGALSIDSGGVFSYSGSNVTTNRTLTVGSGGGTLRTTNAIARTLTWSGSIDNAGTLIFDTTGAGPTNITVSGVLSGTGGITKIGAGTLTLSNVANTYTGQTSINGGRLAAAKLDIGGNDSSLGATVASIPILLSGDGILSYTGASDSTDRLINLTGDGTIQKTAAGTLTLTGNIDNGGNTLSFNHNASTSNITVTSIISGAGSLTKGGTSTGTLTLAGANTYTGKTTINTGTLSINSIGNVNGGSSALGAPTTIPNGTIDLGAATLIYTGSGHASDRVINLTGAGTITASGTGALNLSGGITGTQNLTLSGTASGANATIQSGTIAIGTGNLTKSLAGTWILTSDNSAAYSGITTITTGTLQIGNGGTTGTLGSGSVTNNATLNFNRNNSYTVNNAIGGTGALIQNGTGIITLASTNNTYSGATTINAGTLQAGAANTFSANSAVTLGNAANTFLDLNNFNNTIKSLAGGGILGGNVTLGSGAGVTLTLQSGGTTTYSGVISGAGGLTLNSSGATQTLAGANTYTGATQINAGTLALTNANALGSGSNQSNSVSIVSGATLNINFTTNTLGNTNNITLNGTGVGGAGALISSSSTDTLNNNIILGSDSTIGGTRGMVLNGIISGPFGLNKTGSGTLTLTGANTYIGKTIINAGTLSINSIGNVGESSSALGAPATVANGTIDLGAANLTYTGTGHISNRIINLTGTGTINASGTGSLTLTGGITGVAQNLILTGSGTGNQSGIMATTTGTLTKTSTGTWTLSGANTYTGNTSITGGTLNINSINGLGDSNGGTISVASGAILGFNLSGGSLANSNTITLTGTATLFDGTNIGADTLNNAITTSVASSPTINSSGTGLALTGGITHDGTSLTFTGSGNGTIASAITGTGAIIKSGTGTFTLSSANTYSGLTTINAGILNITNNAGLGTSTSGTTINSTGTLQINNATIANEAITLNNGGILLGTGTVILGDILGNSNITLAGTLGTSRSINTSSISDSFTLNGAINGGAVLTLSGSGRVILNNTVGNTTALSSVTSSGTGTLEINSGSIKTTGSQTYNSAVMLGQDTTFTVGNNASIQLISLANNFTAVPTFVSTGILTTVALTNAASNPVLPILSTIPTNLSLNFFNAEINLPAYTLAGTLSVTAGGAITQSGALAITNQTTLAASNYDITLDNSNNNFGTVVIANANNVTLYDINAMILGASAVSGTLDITAGGAVTQNGNASTGTALIVKTLNNSASNITLGTFANDFSTIDLQTLNSAGSAAVSGTVTYQDATDIQIKRINSLSGNINITTNGNITEGTGIDTGITTTGTSTFNAGSLNDITLNNSANNFGTIAITNAKNVSITDVSAIVLGTSNISGTYDLTAGGNISQSGSTALTIAGTPTFTVTASLSDILLGNANLLDTTPIFTDNGNIRNLTLRNTVAGVATLTLPSDINNLSLTFNNADTFIPTSLFLRGTLTINSGGTFAIADNAIVSTNNTAINITANDLDFNSTGALNSGTAATSITQNTIGGSIGLGDTAGIMSISGDELQRITAGSLTLLAPTDGQIIIDGISIANSENIAGTTTLTATSGTNGSLSFINNSTTFAHALSLIADQTLSVGDGVTVFSNNNVFSITVGDIDLNTTGALNSGINNMTISNNVPTATTIELGNPTGTLNRMVITGSELQRITANNLSISATSDGQILVDGLTIANTENITNTLTLTATAGTTGSITFQNNSSNFARTLTLSTDNIFNVDDGITLATNNAALAITARDINLNTSGILNSGTATTTITQNTTGGSIGLGNTVGTMSISGDELQRIITDSLSLIAPSNGQIIVDGITATNSTNVANNTILAATAGTLGSILFQNASSTFKNGLSITSDNAVTINDGVTVATTNSTLAIASRNLNMNDTGALNSGTGDITIRGITGNVDVGNDAGDNMYISHSMLQRMAGDNLTISNTGNTSILVDGVSLSDLTNIAGTVSFTTNGIIVFQNNSSVFKSVSVSAQNAININTSVTTNDTQTYNGPALLANITLTGTALVFNDPVTLNGSATLNSNGNSILFYNTVNGANDLTLNAGSTGNITFNNNVGGSISLAALNITGNNVTGAINVASLILDTNFANLTGFVNGSFGQEAINKIVLGNVISRGTHFFDGIDMAKAPTPTPVPPIPDVAIATLPNILFPYAAILTEQSLETSPSVVMPIPIAETDVNSSNQSNLNGCVTIGNLIEMCSDVQTSN